MNESIMVALQVYGLGFVISLLIAVLIKGISVVFDRFAGAHKAK
jgi:Na+-transporting methylmalonyl-CoA/oxaloacetate decarboxylase gamma subunit